MENYAVLQQIGKGSFGTADLVLDKRDKPKRYILKRTRLARQPEEQREATIQEMFIQKAISHRNIVRCSDSWLDKGFVACLVLEYCQHGELQNLLRDSRRRYFPEQIILEMFVQVASALAHLHGNGIIHRDIKAANVFVRDDYSLALGDFGLSQMESSSKVLSTIMLGTPQHMAPEIVAGSKTPRYSEKTDIWALGILFFEVTALHSPFTAFNMQGLISKICKAQVPALPDMYSDDWKNVVRLCLSKNPADRPTAQQLLDLPFVKPVVEAVDNKLGPPLVPGSRETVVIDTGEVMEILERCTSKQTGGVAMKQKREAGEVPPKGHPTEGVAPRPQSSGSQREEAAPEGVKAEEFPEVAVNEATCPTTGQRGSGQGPQQASSQSPKPRPLKWPPPLVSTVPRPREPALVKGVGRGGGAGSMRHQGVKRPQTAGSVGSETAASQEKSLPAEALRRRMVPKFGKLAESAANKAPKGNLVGGQDIRAMREPSVPNDQAVTRPKAPASPRVLPPPQAPATETKAQKRTPAPAPQPQPKEQARKEAAAPTEQGGWLALGPTTPHSPGKVSSRALEELRGNRDGKGPEKMHRVPDGPTTVGALAAIGSPGLPGQGKGSCGRSTEAPKAAGGSPAVNQASCAPKPHAEAGPKASTGRKEGEAGAWKGPARRTPPPLPRKGQARPKVATKATRGTNEDRRRLTMDSASSYSAPEGNKSEGKEKPARPEEQPKASGVDNLPARGESAPRGPGKLSHSAPKARVGNVRKAKAVPLLPPPPGEKQVITLAPAPKPPKAPVGDEKAGGAESKTPGWSPGFGPLLEDLIAANAEGTRSLAEQGKFLARYRQLVQC